MSYWKSTLFLVVLLLSIGCSNSGPQSGQYDLIASEKTLPSWDHIEIVPFEREEVPHYQYWVKKATTQGEYENLWDAFGFEKQMPYTNFEEKDVLFLGVHESGSCPYEIEKMELLSDDGAIKVQLIGPSDVEACTDDATPRTFLIGLAKEKFKNVEDAIIVQGGTETKVPIN
ncbi:hypothetical protein [Bacillus sp. Marseille-Q3570]|uniref:hypothetical protein n=1 Tax=Bacillus sp. Marseille-Q3570 TaxID=2963522 RepID=UPI0021B7F248|nr:hypothetical protein [Bacillus sp. Marseille-Q3570]